MWFGASNRAYSRGFTTNFPLTENPISEGGRWTNGGTVGLDWQNIQTNGTSAFGVGVSAGFDDCIAVASGLISTSHAAQGTCHKLGGYTPPSSHECELLVGFTITAHVAQGYECTWGFGNAPQLVRWNGPISGFTVQGSANDNLATGKGWTDTASGSGGTALADGDVVRLVYSVSAGVVTLTVFQNGSQVLTCQDTSGFAIVSGQPGIGSFARTGASMTSYCWSSYTAA